MSIKTWGSSEKSAEIKQEEKKQSSSKEYESEPIMIPWRGIFYLLTATVLLITIFYTVPYMADLIEDIQIDIDTTYTNDYFPIPDDTVYSVIVRDGSTQYNNILAQFTATKGELVALNVALVDKGELCPVQKWEPWRHYLVNIKGYVIPDDSIYIELHRKG